MHEMWRRTQCLGLTARDRSASGCVPTNLSESNIAETSAVSQWQVGSGKLDKQRVFPQQTETTVPNVHPPDSGKVVGVLGGQSTFKVLSEQTGGAYALLEQQIPAGHGPPLHVHRHETEIFYILEGRFEITLDDQTLRAPVGAIAVCPRDIPHTFRNIGPTPGKLLLTIIPGRFANYFLEVDGLTDKNFDIIRTLAASYDVEFLT